MKTVDWSDNRRPSVVRCPSCGAPASIKSFSDGECEYCGTMYLCVNDNFDEVKIYADNQVISTLVVDATGARLTVASRGYGA